VREPVFCHRRSVPFPRWSGEDGHAVNSSSLVDCGGSTASDRRQFGVYLCGVAATVECLNSTGCSIDSFGAAFGAYWSGLFSSLCLTVSNCSGGSIVCVSDNSNQATVAYSNFFWNLVHGRSGQVIGLLVADRPESGSSAAMAVHDCIFSGNSPFGRSIVRHQSSSVDSFTVVNCMFSDSVPSRSHASVTGSTVSATASYPVRMNDASLCVGTPCPIQFPFRSEALESPSVCAPQNRRTPTNAGRFRCHSAHRGKFCLLECVSSHSIRRFVRSFPWPIIPTTHESRHWFDSGASVQCLFPFALALSRLEPSAVAIATASHFGFVHGAGVVHKR
jgi:hypothetical protein